MSSIKQLKLFAFYHSSAAWRVRAVLAMKNVPFKYEAVHLSKGEQHSDDFVKLNPMHQVPALEVVSDNDKADIIVQSIPIIEFIEDNYPENPILPKDTILRAKSRAIAETIAGGIQPLQNLETLVCYTEPLGLEPLAAEDRKKVAQFWIKRKLENLEKLVKLTAGKYCVGDKITIADVALVPQMFNAKRFEVDISGCPTLSLLYDRLMELDMFRLTAPLTCPDAPKQ